MGAGVGMGAGVYFMVTTFHFFLLPFNQFEQNTFSSVFGGKQLSFPGGPAIYLLKDLILSSASGDADLRITTYFVQQ
jgi:hypothetical protein